MNNLFREISSLLLTLGFHGAGSQAWEDIAQLRAINLSCDQKCHPLFESVTKNGSFFSTMELTHYRVFMPSIPNLHNGNQWCDGLGEFASIGNLYTLSLTFDSMSTNFIIIIDVIYLCIAVLALGPFTWSLHQSECLGHFGLTKCITATQPSVVLASTGTNNLWKPTQSSSL